MNGPLVTVMMPAYNHEQFVRKAVESVWNQSCRNLELVVIDDGSTDRTEAILRELAHTSPVPMLVDAQENRGIAYTLNRIVERARGHWLALLSSDDFYATNYIERNLSEALRYGHENVVLHSNAYLVEASGRVTGVMSDVAATEPLQGHAFESAVTGRGHMLPSTLFIRRDLLIEAGGFDPTMVAEDLDLQLRLARRASFHYIPEPIFYSRYTPGSLGKRPWLWGDSIIRSIAKHADILGSRLPGLLSKSSENIAVACIEQGEVQTGLHWSRQALGHSPGTRAKLGTAARLIARSTRALVRSTALGLFGRERLVRLKRKLQRVYAFANDG